MMCVIELFQKTRQYCIYVQMSNPLDVQLNAMYRFCIYKMFLFNTPHELYFLISRIRFHFFFTGTTAIPRDMIFIENLS